VVFSFGLVLETGLDAHDGQRFAPFASGVEGASLQITDPQDGQALQWSSSIPVRAVLSGSGFHSAELRVDGQRRAVQINGDRDVRPWVVDLEWESPGEGNHLLTIQATGADGDLLVSAPLTVTVVPSGTLAFATNRDGSQSVYTMSTEGRGVKRLTAGPGDTRQPAWGGGTDLAYVAAPEIGKPTIQLMVLGTTKVRDLVAGRDPALSLDGTYLAYAATVNGTSQVFVIPAQGGDPVQVTSEAVYAGQPDWSPDGRELAYVAERDGNWDIWLVSLDDGDPLRLTDDPAMDWAPAWSPDGSWLAFVSDRGGNHQICVMRSDGSGVWALTDLDRGAEAPSWSPDGFWLAFVAYTGGGYGINAREIYLMRADGRDQVRLTFNAFDDTQPDWHRVR
jgi:Tol biopolymer transport system component